MFSNIVCPLSLADYIRMEARAGQKRGLLVASVRLLDICHSAGSGWDLKRECWSP